MDNIKQTPSAFDDTTTAVVATCSPKRAGRGQCRGRRKARPKTKIKAKITPNGKDVQVETTSGRIFDKLGDGRLLDMYQS
jgi:hypothetical protein